jgi:hypothetical protein
VPLGGIDYRRLASASEINRAPATMWAAVSRNASAIQPTRYDPWLPWWIRCAGKGPEHRPGRKADRCRQVRAAA